MDSLRQKLKTIRFSFSPEILDATTISKNPFKQFSAWMNEAIEANVIEPNAMTLATVSKNGKPDARIVLLRDVNTKGFSFFTNYNSIKGKEIRHNKNVCLNFFWPEIHRQVRIKGVAEKLSQAVSKSYFDSRPRESRIAAITSQQSEVLSERKELDEKYNMLSAKYSGKKIPKPEHWGGYRVRPVYFEFWQGQTNRLHDRISYSLQRNNRWLIERLNP
jgi:pyridoxamine 5'-phosphate oxidase